MAKKSNAQQNTENRSTSSSGESLSFKENVLAMKNIPKFFKLVWHTSPFLTFINIVLRLLKAGIPLATLYIAKLIVDEVILLMNQSGELDLTNLWTWVIIEFALAFFSELLNQFINLSDGLLGDLVANESSIQLMQHAASLDLPQFEDATFYDKLERARRQTLSRTVLISQVLAQVQDMITMLFLGIGLAVFNPWLILLLVIAIIPSFISENYFNRFSYSLVRAWTPERRELDYLRYIGASDETAKEIKIFGLSDFIMDRFKYLANAYYLVNRRLAIRRTLWGMVLNSLSAISYYVAYAYIIWQTVFKIISIGDLTFLSGAFSRMQALFQGILTRFSSIAQNALYLQDLFDFFDIKPEINSPENPYQLPLKIEKGFTFENVGFKYPNSEVWAVRYLSFELQAGEKLALVGENGAGKTTLVKLLARLYDPDEGRILLDGVDIKAYHLEDYRHMIGVIFQDFVKFQMSAGTNIAIGKIDEKENETKISDSARLSLANSVIEKLPQKYAQMLGKRFSQGVELSGGEWQKVALGRAYMRDASLIILDEPTAALDARAEHHVFKRFVELTAGKTAVLISHRFSTVRMADRILVLKNGELAEIGSHQALLEKNGLYAELFNLQAEGYK
jgi:ATP-binding cassette, subfamily B, bacterial